MDSNEKCHIPKQASEDAAFWQQHIAAHATSGLSKSAYCHAQQVDYARFLYWSQKAAAALKASTPSPLVTIKVAADSLSSMSPVLCTLPLKKGGCLQIHDVQVLSVIFDRLN